jgi:peptidyl-prolyl cis-trans isomerase C
MTLLRRVWRQAALRRTVPLIPAAASLVLGACGGLSEAMTAHTDTVARAAGKEFKIEEAAAMLAANPQIPAQPEVVRALADLWVDYILLATAVAEDTSLAAVDLNAFIAPAREQALVLKLRDQVIRPDTLFTEQEVQQRWTTEGPGAEIRARHILLRAPADATPAQRDSVRQLAESLRQRAVQGEDFAALARQYSEDPGSAQRGGDLDFFGRGRMVAPFEEAAFKLQPGEVSPVVETPFGYHVIRVEERRQQELGEQREQFRQFLVGQAQQQAETTYLDSISKAANVEVQPGGLAVVREVASRPESALRGRAASRQIATYNGGAFTTGEFLEFVRTQPPQVQSMFTSASDEQLQNAVEQLTRKELLLQQARARNVSLTRAEEDSIRSEARQAIRELVRATGLTSGARPTSATIEARVEALIRSYISGQAQLVPLGTFGFLLRDLYPSEINEGTFAQVVAAVEQARASMPAPAPAPGAQGVPGAQPGTPAPQPMPQPIPQPAPQPAPQPEGGQ